MKCTECGREIGDKQKFCKYCGAPVKQIIVSVENTSQIKKCKNCDAILKPGTAFCTQCGTPISAVDVKASMFTKKNKPKNGRIGRLIIVVITIIVLVLVIFIGYYFINQYGLFELGTKEPVVSKVTQEDESIYEESRSTENVLNVATEPEKSSVADLDVIDVEATVLQMRDKYDKIVSGISSNLYDMTVVNERVIAYSEQGQIKALVVKKDYDGYNYARSFYYDGNKLFFAYYEGSDSHKLYFNEDQLIRWRYCPNVESSSKAINYDLEDTSEYYRWENDVLVDSKKLLTAWKDALMNKVVFQEYILEGSDSRYILKSELQGFTAEQCRLARNEIYARHGRKFDDESLQNYFNLKNWYIPTVASDEFEESMLNSYELANRDLIVEYEKECGYR